MKVVFLETVEGSGTRGEVRTVANGYARNYLLPRGLAAAATPALLRRAETLAAQEEERQRLLDGQAHELVGKLEGQRLIMPVRVGEQDACTVLSQMLTSPRRLGRFSAKNWTGVAYCCPRRFARSGSTPYRCGCRAT